MFANVNIGVMNFAFPDVCSIPTPAPVPTPLVNIALSFTHIPSQFKVICGGGLAENLLTTGTISNGDQAGLALGVVSGLIMGPDRPATSSVKVFYGAIPATRLTSMQTQNGMLPNAVGLSLTPAQFKVLLIS
ncbi:MAG: DUF4150 domain-containing protein [Rhodocyclaceae bacterium]|nr:DUF4150 domain-containing protein [Rhodocyclaceae bacterium]MBX3668283.1 DUF4150 domain-containing protein [Rhodocyclaceae bacterium]